MSALGRERTLESLDSSPSLLHCMSPLWVESGHSQKAYERQLSLALVGPKPVETIRR